MIKILISGNLLSLFDHMLVWLFKLKTYCHVQLKKQVQGSSVDSAAVNAL